ncbi:glutamine-hydrolyzing GMP synthase [[Mycoplasma] testudinis]|uniref:glutamine-hydrolyzing GMP synthase n=1 Tax=[Mycoplasma] testudinis TaxID=33924 RepID=UPI00069628A9|nr:glutamine-hydrolyzing GMP synthase [[Mycoplasma] testudinis]
MKNNINPQKFIDQVVELIRAEVKDKHVICAISGGVDSTVSATLVQRAIGNQLHCVFVDHGLLRHNEVFEVLDSLRNKLGLNIWHVDAKNLFLDRLKGIVDPEEKRHVIGKTFIDVFVQAAKDLNIDFPYLVQGTIYPDILESKNNEKTVKSHHNVGGLPENFDAVLIEPLRDLYKEDVRELAKALGLPQHFIQRQPFPGPGLGVRVIGEVTEKKLEILRKADYIFRSAMEQTGLAAGAFQYFAILPETFTTGVREGERLYGHTIALRAIHSKDAVTAEYIPLPHKFLKNVSEQICLQIPEVNRVVYDITDKPAGTIEWE